MSFAYSKDDLLDAALFNSRMKNDSLLLFDGVTPLTPWKAIVPNDHELYLTLDTIKFRLTRILEEDAMVEILKIDTVQWTDPHFKNYIDGYRRRRDQ